MREDQILPSATDALRRRAEARLREQQTQLGQPFTEAEIQRQLHELHVQRIELELQNEELRESHARLERSLERYIDLYDFAPMGYFTLTDDGTIQKLNLAGAALLGQERSHLIGQRFGLFVSPENRPAFADFLDRALATSSKEVCEIALAPNGAPLRHLHLECLREETDPSRRCYIVAVDITVTQQIKERLRESEAKLQSIFRAAPIGLGLTVDRVIREANQTLCQLLGYAREELIGKSARLVYLSQSDFDFVGTEKYRQIWDKGVGAVETRWRRKDGAVRDILLSSAPIDPGDFSKGISFSAMDITQRKQTEALLRKSEERYRSLVNLLPYGVQENDCEGRITFANLALERLHGPWDSGVVGRFIWDFVADPAGRERLRDYLGFLVREQPPPMTYFSKDRCADGALIDIQVEWMYNRDEHGRVQGFISVITDITAQREAESRLTESAERLQQISRRLLSVQEEERRSLARELHDDFGQQLAALKINLAMLERDLQKSTHRHHLADCIQIVEYAQQQIQDTARRLRPAMLDDLGLAEALHWYTRGQSERTGCVIEVRDRLVPLSPELETAAFRIVQEAVNNAIRHGTPHRIAIAIAVDGGELSLMIQDDGAGFDPDAVPDWSKSGLGLIGMRERVELLGGRFRLVSRPGAGARIEATIPLGGG